MGNSGIRPPSLCRDQRSAWRIAASTIGAINLQPSAFGMQAIGGQAVFWPATLVDEGGELIGVDRVVMGGVSFIQAFRFKMSAGGWFSVLDRQDLVLDKS